MRGIAGLGDILEAHQQKRLADPGAGSGMLTRQQPHAEAHLGEAAIGLHRDFPVECRRRLGGRVEDIHPKLKPVFHDYATKQSEIVRKHGAIPIFLMTWAYKDKPEMTAQLAEEYTVAGNSNDALVIPSGLAFAKATSKRPELELYQPDKRHPSLAGTYLSAATAYAAVYRQSPVGNKYTAGIDGETVKFLQTMAWETVEEYFGK